MENTIRVKMTNIHPSGVACIDIIDRVPYVVGEIIKQLWMNGEAKHSVFSRTAVPYMYILSEGILVEARYVLARQSRRDLVEKVLQKEPKHTYLYAFLKALRADKSAQSFKKIQKLRKEIKKNDPLL